MWDFSHPYRTELWYNEVKDLPLKSPICIPSYRRPNAPVFSKKSKLFQIMTPQNTFIFIRNTLEELKAYVYLEDHVTLVPLPNRIEEIGLTRNFIVKWAQVHNYENIFMFDDRILDFKTLIPKLTKNNKLVMGEFKEYDTLTTLKLWEFLHTIFPTTLSGILSKGLSWNPSNIDREFKVNSHGSNWGFCLINVQDLKQYNINYPDTRELGIEDMYMLYTIMNTGLPFRVFTDIFSIEIYPDQTHKLNPNSGGAIVDKSILTRDQRLFLLMNRFLEKVLKIKWGDKIPELSFMQRKKDGLKLIKLNFSKYWAPYYEQHKVK